MQEFLSKKPKDTEEIAKNFLRKLKGKNPKATTICLFGDLGTGKTTFVRAFAKHSGIRKKITSPTFVIMKRYVFPKKGIFFKNLFHIDAYRLKNEQEVFLLGWKEILSNPDNLVFIEWPENVKKAISQKHHKIRISHTKEGHRKFKIS